ncbi:ArfGap-domain-containing protein [Athelia psychrophila]|uniref:ArfGap-domain-containing protein n=1 Tax=Athelia psychrophila TaxID=1759441 RepID=A0A166IU74_9AGAM|nr:ArfGap-domain-containing protein [Fibularhizoctonia sp. CBS 109695]
MSDQAAAKRILQELVKREDLKNKACIDCGNPNPQWASLSFAVFLCLQCAGTHRGFGVHISFVRSVSMDTWQDEQIRRMQLGGNAPFRTFMQSYSPADEGGYQDGATSYDTFHCWAATQYREKLDAELAGRPWTQASPPAGSTSPNTGIARPSSAQGLRKSRASARTATGSSLRNDSSSPSLSHSNPGTPDYNSGGMDQKSSNEAYFASKGQANASRPENLPPSQGGRYTGFGSTPSPSPGDSQHPSFGLTSAAAPSLNDFQENPRAALSKGWSLFSAAVAGASRVVSENVIQPGLEKARDPTLHASVLGYVSDAQKAAAAAGTSANSWSKNQFGVDVAGHVGGVVEGVKGRMGGPERSGYGSLPMDHEEEGSALYHDDTDDFFTEFSDRQQEASEIHSAAVAAPPPVPKKDDWEDSDWKDF